ncbi:MAG TPA: prolyl oligopeptidase family serine peptidase, partial [Puia sp.]|nr:prolyl oligopeptidase family serine peptidase [Puia sp.]
DMFNRRVTLNSSDPLLIVAFDPLTKFNGFFSAVIGHKGDPEKLTMGPYTYYHEYSQVPNPDEEFGHSIKPMKAAHAKVWVVTRETAEAAPNYFLTKDFKSFSPLSNSQPQEHYNWLKAELVTWKLPGGSPSQGVLYKPENFNPKNKYPLIFYIYRGLSHLVYGFPDPGFAEARINVPWFVSRGYLVFMPDVHFTISSETGEVNGESVVNAVESAAKYLTGFSWVDANKLGVQGHSFGGFEASYLATHSKIFAAVAEASGGTDAVSGYLTLCGFTEETSKQQGAEIGYPGAYGASLWERPDLYLKNSSVLHADQVSAPLLIMHNKLDNQIQWRQGVEFYMALRRLGKRVWMLQYDNEAHGVLHKDDQVDYTYRLTQFFDHYLKDSACPKWMLYGIPAKMKGVDYGFELVREKDQHGKWMTPQYKPSLTDAEWRKEEAAKAERADIEKVTGK